MGPRSRRRHRALFHPDCHRRLRNCTESADPASLGRETGARGLMRLLAITAGGDFHPALRTPVPGHPGTPAAFSNSRWFANPPAAWPSCWANDIVMSMTLEQLRVFVAVAERQHMTRAAESLHLAQSAVSAAIAALEARHGAKLFHRVGRGIELTEAGALFLNEARAVLARAEAAELVLSELGGLQRGTLAIHASKTIASSWP